MRDDHFLTELQTRFNSGEKFKFIYFWGHRSPHGQITAACFSQWFSSPFVVNKEHFPTAEHFMMAEKARLFEDHETRRKVLNAPNPGAAKVMGRQARGFDEAIWEQHRFAIVCRANEAKFTQNADLRDYLLRTGSRTLVEASPTDRIWGIGLSRDDQRAKDPNLWRGLNLLGFALMQVRDSIGA